MVSYSTLIRDAEKNVPGFAEKYREEIANDSIDEDSGGHTVFSVVFVPLLKSIIKGESTDKQAFDYLEELENSDDTAVREVCDYSVLEELCDAYSDVELLPFLGDRSKASCREIRKYIVGPQ